MKYVPRVDPSTVPLAVTVQSESKLSLQVAPSSIYIVFLRIFTVPLPVIVITGGVVSTTFTVLVIWKAEFPLTSVWSYVRVKLPVAEVVTGHHDATRDHVPS